MNSRRSAECIYFQPRVVSDHHLTRHVAAVSLRFFAGVCLKTFAIFNDGRKRGEIRDRLDFDPIACRSPSKVAKLPGIRGSDEDALHAGADGKAFLEITKKRRITASPHTEIAIPVILSQPST